MLAQRCQFLRENLVFADRQFIAHYLLTSLDSSRMPLNMRPAMSIHTKPEEEKKIGRHKLLLLHIRGIKYSKILANTLISIIRGHSAQFFFMTQGTTSVVNLDSYVFSSIKGTLSSINMILKDGRINDSWTLLRKYHDSIIINIYSCLFLKLI